MKETKINLTEEYTFMHNGVINVIQFKPSGNRKLGRGYIITTYHISPDQFDDFENDEKNCLGCPFSFSSKTKLSGKCYTHKGPQRWGLASMIKRLSKMKIPPYNKVVFEDFMQRIDMNIVSLIRFGAYGEPPLLPIEVIKRLYTADKSNGYTHAWKKFPETGGYFQASVHTVDDMREANIMGFRAFRVGVKKEADEIVCPASKESKRKKTCIQCKMCNGAKKNVLIAKH